MKLNTETRTIQRIGVGKETGFKIAANAQAFDILSSKLYTDTKLAIVRELSTNAVDAQKEAGNGDKPFDVHLPNGMEPYFAIRDYGTGLSPETLESIYTTYFESTRNDSNEYTGALGLGSKSPFSYTDMFTVTSYHNGTEYVYSAFKGETGEPTVALLNQKSTSDPNGLEIRIEVKDGDGYYFEEAAKKVYRFFDPKPNIVGARIDIPDPEPTVAGTDYQLFESSKREAGTPSYINVVMGNICYSVGDGFKHGFGYNGVVVLFMDIGECSIAASREELHYDDRTKANVQARLTAAENDARDQIKELVKDSTCLLDQAINERKYAEILDLSQGKNRISISTEEKDKYTLVRVELRNDKMYIGRDRWQRALNPRTDSQYIFVENDLSDDIKQSDKSKLRHWIREQRTNGVRGNVYLAKIEDHKRFNEVFSTPTIKMTQLPDPPKRVYAGGGSTGPRTYIKEMVHYETGRLTDQWNKVDTDKPDTTDAIAVPRKGYYVVWNGFEVSAGIALLSAKLLGYKRVYGIASKHFERIRGDLGLGTLEDEARQHATKTAAGLSTYEIARMQHGLPSYSHKLIKVIKGLSTACDDIVQLSKTNLIDNNEQRLISNFSITLPAVPDFTEIFRQRYPLIAHVDLHYAKLNDVVEYITLKENN